MMAEPKEKTMFGIGMQEMILILAVALIVVGPKRLPEIAKMMGRAMGEFRKATSELKESIDPDNSLSDVKKAFTEMNQSVSNTVYDAMRTQEEAPKAPVTDPSPEHPPVSDSGDTKRV